MRDTGPPMDDSIVRPDGYVGFALDVIEHLARRRRNGVGVLQDSLIDRVIDALGSPDPATVPAIAEILRAGRATQAQIIDGYIPACARRLGRDWEMDRVSFALVTLGVARLQQLLHVFTDDVSADMADAGCASSVLLIVPPGEQHTLGASVLTSQLRRKGVSVCLRYAPGLQDLSPLLDSRRFDAALITVGSEERVEVCAKLVKTLTQLSKGTLRIAVGGAVGDSCRGPLMDSGAHLVTSDIGAVVEEFGLEEREKSRHAG